LSRYKKHNIDIFIDRFTIEHNPQTRQRLADSVETAIKESRGLLLAIIDSQEKIFSEKLSCPVDGTSLPEIEPRTFSFNSPYGACPECSGLGTKLEVDRGLVVPEPELSVNEGALKPWAAPITTRTHRWKYSWSSYYDEMLQDIADRNNIPLDKPFNKLTQEQQDILLYGKGDFEGVITNLQRRYRETESEYVKEEIYNKYITRRLCPACLGRRLKKEALSVTVGDKTIADVSVMSISQANKFFENLQLSAKEKIISKQILKEITQRLKFLNNVGLDYITIDRESATLAGGEAQRIHLATQIGSGLTGVLYVLDEPTIGLHQRDNKRLLNTLMNLRDSGNTLIVVEHDEETIRSADWVVDLGPGAGVHGGKVVAAGPLKTILASRKSLTAMYLKGKLQIPFPGHEKRRKPQNKFIRISGASQFNLKNINVNFPLGLFICITGVSGSGKSTLIYEILYKALARKIYKSKESPGAHKSLSGTEFLDKVIIVDQSPIGRTPRSNPATYTNVFGYIRELFSKVPESRKRGYGPGRFSFNVKGGRCENCQGGGVIKIEMQFLPDVYVKCDVCSGKRFNEETLQIKFKSKNISEVLLMPVEEAIVFFKDFPKIYNILKTLDDVGLGYIQLGQSATTLSGGEAQRVKLASELQRRSTGKTLYLLDEPTTGLHFADVEKLLNVLHRIVDRGNTVIVIEHNLEVIKTSDWIIDLGPEGGDTGGEIVAQGPPENIMSEKNSFTGHFLRKYFERISKR
ncbi:MAG: excinuclease ABC subunit UvrA, partial [Elusimicrobiota bacterium]